MKNPLSAWLFGTLVLAAVALPFREHPKSKSAPFPMSLPPAVEQYIDHFRFAEAPLAGRSSRFAKDFPGSIRRFRSSTAELLVRTVASATRLLHSSSDCYRGLGYLTHPLPSEKDDFGNVWACFSAQRDGETLIVCEHITGASGGHWSDVSQWYWAAALSPESGPWSALTRIRTAPPAGATARQ